MGRMHVYLDHNATTPLAPAALETVVAVLRGEFGNASSVHAFGQTAKSRLDGARAAVADHVAFIIPCLRVSTYTSYGE